MRRCVLAGALVLAAVVTAASASGAQEPPPSTTAPEQVPTEDIIPEPDSGEAPSEAGDRGGGLQLAVLALMVAGVGIIALLAVRQSRTLRDGGRS